MKIFVYFIFFLLSSCSLYNFQDENDDGERVSATQCVIPEKKTNIISSNMLLNEQFEEYAVVNQLSFPKQALLFSILQPISYPNATTLNSKIFTIIKSKGKTKAFSITSPGLENSYKEYLDLISSELSISTQEKVAFFKKFDKTYPRQIPISKEFQNYLQENKKFYNKSTLREITFRGNQLLKYGESIKRPNISDIRLNEVKQRPLILNTTFKGPKNLTCNFDYRLFDGLPVLQRRTQKIYSNIFAIVKDKDNYMITVTSSAPILQENPAISFLLYSRPIESFNAALCFNGNDEILISKNSPHAEQVLLNGLTSLIEGSISNQIRTFQLKQRHLKLLYPKRTIYEIFGITDIEESQEAREDLFFVTRLGNIDLLKIDKITTLFEDPRVNGPICN